MGVELAYTDAVARATDGLYAKVARVIPEIEWPAHAPLIAEINRLKREKNAVILGHNYMTPEIFHCVGDFVGDSLALAREAARTDAKVIVQAGVHFMAETSKILSPDKTVLIPDTRAGCSLAASITGADVRLLQPETSRPAGGHLCEHLRRGEGGKRYLLHLRQCGARWWKQIAREFGTDTVIMIPDQYLARNVAAKTGVKVITWEGACEVHERFTAAGNPRLSRQPIPASPCWPIPNARRRWWRKPISPARPRR